MSRLSELEARRRQLIARCDVQRAAFAAHIEKLKESPLSRAAGALLGRPAAGRGLIVPRPLTVVAVVAALMLLRRPRQALRLLRWTRAALLFGSRAAVVLQLLDQWRGRRRARAAAQP